MTDQEFLGRIELRAEEIEAARLTVPGLHKIFRHHETNSSKLLRAGEGIQSTLRAVQSVHSTRVRVKTPVSLIRKIVRKQSEDPERDITLDNYREDVRDLIGLRALHLFKEDWKPIHKEILQIWDLHPDDPQPLAYHREGDSKELMQDWEEAGCVVKGKEAGYRSIHYVVLDKPNKRDRFCAEIQARTVFEEAWSEIDHRVRYPDYSDDPLLKEYLLILNRIAGSADEMGSFLLRFQQHIQVQNTLLQQREAERDAKETEISALENDLGAVKKALDQAVKDKTLSDAERSKLERTLDRVPAIYRRDFLKEFSEQNARLQEQFNRRMRDMMGNPGGLAFERNNTESFQRLFEQAKRDLKERVEPPNKPTDKPKEQKANEDSIEDQSLEDKDADGE